MAYVLTKFEYDSIFHYSSKYTNNYFYKGKEFYQDFVFSHSLNKYLIYIEKHDFLKNKALKVAIIKKICICQTFNILKSASVKKSLPDQNIDEISSKIVLEDEISKKSLYSKINAIYDNLNPIEKQIYDKLSSKESDNKSKKVIIEELGISKDEYNHFTDKMRKIVRVITS